MLQDPGAQPPSSTPPDLAELAERLGDPAIVEAVVGAYRDALPERLDAIEAARRAPDADAVRAAHSLRSASALLGLVSLAEACGALETALRAEPAVAVPALVDDVLERAEQARRGLDSLDLRDDPPTG